MPKLKTRKSFAKRVKKSSKGKISKLKAGQNHFNAREKGKTTRNKRRAQAIPKALLKHLTKLI